MDELYTPFVAGARHADAALKHSRSSYNYPTPIAPTPPSGLLNVKRPAILNKACRIGTSLNKYVFWEAIHCIFNVVIVSFTESESANYKPLSF